jgi:hypothetical protein
LLSEDDALAKGNLDQLGKLAIEPRGSSDWNFSLVCAVVIQLSWSASDTIFTQP